jgi:hypothetical protein
MAGRRHVYGARLLRVLTVVAGVFAMHGLTSDHDAAMAMPGMPMVVMDHPVEVHAVPAGDMQDMGGACVAVLTGLVLLLSLLLGLRSLLVWHPVAAGRCRGARTAGQRSPPRTGPLLSLLGVLRI